VTGVELMMFNIITNDFGPPLSGPPLPGYAIPNVTTNKNHPPPKNSFIDPAYS